MIINQSKDGMARQRGLQLVPKTNTILYWSSAEQ